ncbi:MocR-like pyridoxine biosynthesis transcription factor PdxR [Martelella alba]|uniref:PLP-dependent aminotransferase family protein n=1 Tax=Martelella alba TaxID=2590451 RepID=A0ABY2SGF4_9HYPH|nr:PLP-dependent aminotransferase family protein [Martelella alba]TKI03496.1 PLP-dependent aminotransferase family protein [Martelella alba]
MRSLLGDLVAHRLARTTSGALGKRVYDALQGAIAERAIAPGARLPASRDLAVELGVSRNTVLVAYEQLQSEGYLQTRAGSGTFICDVLPEPCPTTQTASPGVKSSPLSHRYLSRRGNRLLSRSGVGTHQWGAFMPGVPDVSHFPGDIWRKIERRIGSRLPVASLSYSHHGGFAPLQQALVEYLRVVRSVHCRADQILITAGTHQSLDLLAKMLCDPGDRAWIEEPGYWGIRNVLAINGVEIVPVPVDGFGLNPPAIGEDFRPPRLICLTPSHQYPLGVVMSLERRQALLALAREWGSLIIEDDYDSEFRFAENPIPALQGLATEDSVIYLGTFSKTLYPGLRISYAVLPQALAPRIKMAHSELYRGGNGLAQLTLAEFIRDGHYAAHVRRMRQIYGRRREALIAVIERELGPEFVLHDSKAGLHLILALPDTIDDVALSAELEQQGILTRALSGYYMSGAQRRGLILGYACVDADAMAEAFAPIARCLVQRLPPGSAAGNGDKKLSDSTD